MSSSGKRNSADTGTSHPCQSAPQKYVHRESDIIRVLIPKFIQHRGTLGQVGEGAGTASSCSHSSISLSRAVAATMFILSTQPGASFLPMKLFSPWSFLLRLALGKLLHFELDYFFTQLPLLSDNHELGLVNAGEASAFSIEKGIAKRRL